MAFSSALPYTPHKTKPQFVGVCFKFVRTTVFLLPFSLFVNTFVSYILFRYIMSTLLTKM